MTSTQFWLIRHGETQWNADRRLQGALDVPLNTTGIEQAQRLGAYLRSPSFDARIDAIVSSDLGRALETARIAAEHFDLTIALDPELRERCYGIYEGRDWASLNGERAGQPVVDFRQPELAVENGESLSAFAARVEKAFQNLAQHYVGKNVMVFSHGGVIDIAWRLTSGATLDAPRPAPILNASINCFAIDPAGDWRALEWGQTNHLVAAALDDVI